MELVCGTDPLPCVPHSLGGFRGDLGIAQSVLAIVVRVRLMVSLDGVHQCTTFACNNLLGNPLGKVSRFGRWTG